MALQAQELIRLQELDTEIASLDHELANLGTGERTRQILAMRQKIAELSDQKVSHLQGHQRGAELQLAAVEDKWEASNKRLFSGAISNPRELSAVQEEIAMLGRQKSRLDELILKAMEELETAVPAAEQARQLVGEAERKIAEQTEQAKNDVARLRAALREAAAKREEAAVQLAADTLARYEKIRARHENLAVGVLVDSACGSCLTKLPSGVAIRVRRAEEYIICENCARFLLRNPEA